MTAPFFPTRTTTPLAAPRPAAPVRSDARPAPLSALRALLPGLLLCLIVTLFAYGLAAAEQWLFGRAWLEALVLAILLGTLIRTGWAPDARFSAGIGFSAKILLEVAVVLLGASASVASLVAAGPALLLGIAALVAVAILASFVLGRLLGLAPRMALLVACGNAICGNSAIAAVAPVIGAEGEDVAASIGFTAVLGVGVVLGLPLLGAMLGLAGMRYGMLAGLTVYAVPQVIAAAAPLGATAVQAGTLVKLVRVLMLGPVCLLLALLAPRLGATGANPGPRPRLGQLVPWFILGFLLLLGLRSADLVPHTALAPIARSATLLTTVSMAGLGLGVDLRAVTGAGGRVTLAVALSLAVLIGLALALIRLLPPA
ncbi:YeiH family protein [Sphingomonas morindae]|uniref:Sulfate exporter family transporter n=1 Tax=Sphingomonas morindae TaxID=1541170 RepID=A0ABY4XDD5_9SPHN|nr:putative sulfate exporter family transporter [Sphingomonas morindae]USI74933.1 putative sulfate exporter family transporter [Sphingomonas morindae]